MVFPAVVAAVNGETATDNTTHTVAAMPTGTQPGDVLLAVFTAQSTPTVTATGWTKLGQQAQSTSLVAAIFWKVATGSDTLTFTTNSAEQSTWVVIRIAGASGIAGGTASSGNSSNGNPPAHTAASAGDYLWVATWSGDGTMNASSPPSGFSNVPSGVKTATGLQSASTYTAALASAGTSQDPGTFTNTARAWVCWTVAVAPLTVAPPPPITGQVWPRGNP